MNLVDSVLLENIDKPSSLFIFPTNVAASRWADHLLRLRAKLGAEGTSAGGTVSMDKFIAWDTFKQTSIRSKMANRQSIPAVLRKMFISALIRENAESPVFSSLIRAEWAGQAGSFTAWLTGILPQLGAWFKHLIGLPIACIGTAAALEALKEAETGGDDRDLFNLALRYSQFLEQRGLFEPAWETPPFEDTGKKCFVFFPESLSDFSEYKELLAASSHVKTISVGESRMPGASEIPPPARVFYHANSRSEITEAALYILAMNSRHHVPWDSISVSIPDDEHYGPYLLREFANRNIPYIVQIGKALSQYPAGQFFAALAGCASADFSFDSLKELLLNQHLPWKENNVIQELINFGIKNNCISSWIDDDTKTPVNVWEDAFEHPFGAVNAGIRHFFNDLKRRINALCRANSFAEIRKQYFAFRERFFEMALCLEETDTILSRCISELMYLVEIEKSFPDVRVSDHYGFFTGYLGEVNFLAQSPASGVAILPYRTAAPAPFDCHIVLGASQSNLAAVFSSLAFLPKNRRDKLGITDNDASLAFIRLHQFNSRLPAAFFCAEQTFSGYAIPHSALSANAPSKPRQRYGDDVQYADLFAPDLYREEQNCYASLHWPDVQAEISPKLLHQNQKQGFEAWQARRTCAAVAATDESPISPPPPPPLLQRKISEKFCCSNEYPGKFSVSSSSLGPYFKCPLIWIFSRVLNLENVAIETGLMASNTAGDVYHAVLNLFLDELKQAEGTIAAPIIAGGTEKKPEYQLTSSYSDLLAHKIDTVFESFPRLPHSEHQVMSMLTARLLQAEKSLFFSRLENFLAIFCSCFAGFKVIATEEKYALPREKYFLNGRIDCILEDKSRLVIVDFKTKYSFKLSDYIGEDGLSDFQLPMYIRLAESKFKQEVHSALFFSLIDTKPLVLFGDEKNCIPHGSEQYHHIMHEFDNKSAIFAETISSGDFSFSPVHPEKCRDCDYNKVCRTLYKVYQGKR